MAKTLKIRGVRPFGAEVTKGMGDLMHTTGKAASLRARSYAKAKAPVNTGFHQSNISNRTIKRATGTYISLQARAHYAAYLEFGTGAYVRVPPGHNDLALEFIGKVNPGNPAKPMIARPHLIPALERATEEWLGAIKETAGNL